MKRYLTGFFLTILFGYGGLLLVNAVIDPVDLIEVSPLPYDGLPSPRFHKIEYLKQHHNRFNTYLFGSSRIGMINPKQVEKYLPGARVYNMTCNSCNQYEYLHHLKFMLENDFDIENLFLQVDLSDIDHYAVRQDDFTARMHPDVVKESTMLFYLDYLTSISITAMSEKINNNLQHKKPELLENGMDDTSEREEAIRQDAMSYYEQVFTRTFSVPLKARNPVGILKETSDAISEIIQLCEDHDISLHVFTTPHHYRFLLAYHPQDYYDLLTFLASKTEFYDFSGINSVTQDFSHYYEESHYRTHVGDWIVQSILTDNPYFGDKINQSTLAQILEARRTALQVFLLEQEFIVPGSWN